MSLPKSTFFQITRHGAVVELQPDVGAEFFAEVRRPDQRRGREGLPDGFESGFDLFALDQHWPLNDMMIAFGMLTQVPSQAGCADGSPANAMASSDSS